MSEYDDLVVKNWASVFVEDIRSGMCIPMPDGTYKTQQRESVESPWIFTNMKGLKTAGEVCHRIHRYIFPKLNIIPINCHNCFKVVVKPRTVTELFELQKLQKQLGLPSKAGIELRQFVPRLYGGYFYNLGIEEGKKCYELVRKRVSERISPDIEVILKRACTEFEIGHGPSDKWEININQKNIEDEFNKRYVEENHTTQIQTDDAINNIKLSWILYAAQNHDKTYKELTGGQALVPECEYVTYHEEME